MTQVVIGIDPGLTGAIAALDFRGSLLSVCDMPTMQVGAGSAKVKRCVNGAALSNILREMSKGNADDVLVVVERVSAMPGQGVAGVFSLGETAGCIRGVLTARGYSTEYVSPRTWKRHFGMTADKEQARAKAIMLYPSAPLSRVKDHNRAEAILLARWWINTSL